jgi:hypothetical protein
MGIPFPRIKLEFGVLASILDIVKQIVRVVRDDAEFGDLIISPGKRTAKTRKRHRRK